jgi:hypothetical protein
MRPADAEPQATPVAAGARLGEGTPAVLYDNHDLRVTIAILGKAQNRTNFKAWTACLLQDFHDDVR